MHQLVYISTSRAPVSAQILDEILKDSRANNETVGITGLLVTGGIRFLQVLEGPVQAVSATFDRIKADERHMACVVLTSRSVTTGAFGNWSMAHRTSGSGSSARDLIYAATEALEDPGLQAEFRAFADLHDQPA